MNRGHYNVETYRANALAQKESIVKGFLREYIIDE
jgi:hypothetical protein